MVKDERKCVPLGSSFEFHQSGGGEFKACGP